MLHADIKEQALQNDNFRKVIYTGEHSQVVLMSLLPGEDIGEEVHHDLDQILVLVEGVGEAVIDGVSEPFKNNDLVFVPAETRHNFKNTSDEAMKLFTVYAPPAHADGVIHRTKTDAQKEE